jgi:hypothetical protein
MGKARNIARLIVDSGGAVDAGNLTNAVPADGSISTAKIANSAVTMAKLSATGTPGSGNYLRGDGSWQAVSSTPTTAQVLSATAGATAGAVGTYMLATGGSSDIAFGGTIAGSSLNPVSTAATARFNSSIAVALDRGAAQSGTWRAMGTYTYYRQSNYSGGWLYGATLWLRIS